MDKKKEDRIIDEAFRILERRGDELAMDAMRNASLKIDLRKVQTFGAYLAGARAAFMLFTREWNASWPTRKERPYLEAEWRLILSSKKAMYEWLLRHTPIRYRNHVEDKRGHLVRVDAYFAEELTLIRAKDVSGTEHDEIVGEQNHIIDDDEKPDCRHHEGSEKPPD